MKRTSKIVSLLLVLCVVVSLAVPAFAASIADATIDTSKTANLTIYKYDFTNAAKDGIWKESSYVSTGQYDGNVNSILGGATRKGDTDKVSDLGNGQTSNGYAIKGVEYTYLKVADIYQWNESDKNNTDHAYVELLYKFNKGISADMLKAIGLPDGMNSYAPANASDTSYWFYESDVIINALADALANNATTVKNALETYIKAKGGTAMQPTDADGKTGASNLALGLYLIIETKVPEMVTETTDPFFVSLPMTNVNGGGDGINGNNASVTDGGHAWLYDVTVYPKNRTGIVTLEKTVREAVADTGKNGGSATDITDGYKHYATASTGDTVEFQIISTLPSITSASTYLTTYTLRDVLSAGMSYGDVAVKIEWFTDAECTDKVATWVQGDGKFSVNKILNSDGSHTMTLKMEAAGLNEINAANVSAGNINGSLFAGYSNYTMRVTYNATLNSDASMVYGDAGNSNKVVLTWCRSNADYLDTLVDDCHVYSYGIDLDKDFSDGKDAQELYDHVLFKVQNVTDNYYVKAELADDGVWYVVDHVATEAEATAMHPVTWNGEKGQLVIKGLEDDAYILTEIETANSYLLLADNIDLTIIATDDATRPCDIYSEDVLGVIQNDSRFNFDGGLNLALSNIPQAAMAHNMLTASAVENGNDTIMLPDEVDTASTNALAKIQVVNNHGFKLPQTGEIGTQMLPIIGGTILGIAMLGMFIVLLPKRKSNKEEE